MSADSGARFLFPPLYAICDADACRAADWELVAFAGACLEGGATLLQIRGKHLSGRELLDASAAIVDQAAGTGALVIVNDRPDIARLANAAGVHIGQDDLPAVRTREIVGGGGIVGLSTHTPEEYDAALAAPIDYVALGPVFATRSKDTARSAIGLDRLRAAARRAAERRLPLVAIGGITLERAPGVIAAGARSVAVISDLLTGGDPARRVRQFLQALG